MEYPDTPQVERCLSCREPVDYCQGGHGQPCESCLGWEGAHEPDCAEVSHLPWVTVISFDEGDLPGEAEAHREDSDWDALVNVMMQWDYGEETDAGGTWTPVTEEQQIKHGTWFYTEARDVPWGAADSTFDSGIYRLCRGVTGDFTLYRRALPST